MPSLVVFLAIFLIGLLLNRSRIVHIAAAAAFVLGLALVSPVPESVVHTLGRVFTSLT